MSHANSGQFKTDNSKDLLDCLFSYGSCRRYVKVGPMILFGTGESVDKIYNSIRDKNIEFLLSIGYQVYYDTMDSFF